jgi:hypothetical protein
MGAELYAHFSVASDATIESQELRELAEDAGGGEVPMAGEEGRIVARLDPASKVSVGQEAELFVDATRLHLFDPENGVNLTVEHRVPPATTGDGAEGDGAAAGAPADTTQDVTGEDPEARRGGGPPPPPGPDAPRPPGSDPST